MGKLPLLMGIVNVTPDSFSDGGQFFDAEAAVEHGLRLAAEGADILDVGGESTRPGAAPVDAEEELRRVMPVVEALCKQTDVPVSIDTSKASVARHAIDAGAEIINDVTALAGDPAMLPLAVETGCGVCAMHMPGTPRTMQDDPVYADVVAEVLEYLRAPPRCPAGRRHRAGPHRGGSGHRLRQDDRAQSSTAGQRLAISRARLSGAGRPFAEAFPRRGESGDAADSDRTAGTIGVALSLARQGVQILRVHDVAAVRQALLLFQAAGGLA